MYLVCVGTLLKILDGAKFLLGASNLLKHVSGTYACRSGAGCGLESNSRGVGPGVAGEEDLSLQHTDTQNRQQTYSSGHSSQQHLQAKKLEFILPCFTSRYLQNFSSNYFREEAIKIFQASLVVKKKMHN